MASSTTKKILMLHGYTQNATIFSKRLGALRKACGKNLDLVFVDAPIVLTPADLAETFATSPQQSSLDAFGAQEATDSDPSLAPRAWWKTDSTRAKNVGLEDSILYLRDILAKDHYDGIFGFSQGAAMAALISALLEKPDAFPQFLVDGKLPHPPFTFCIAAAGFRPISALCDAILLPSFTTPTLHIVGRTDALISEERINALLELSANKRVEYHDGGHFVPSRANWRNFIKAYLNDPLGDVPSPSPSADSQPASGTATPLSS